MRERHPKSPVSHVAGGRGARGRRLQARKCHCWGCGSGLGEPRCDQAAGIGPHPGDGRGGRHDDTTDHHGVQRAARGVHATPAICDGKHELLARLPDQRGATRQRWSDGHRAKGATKNTPGTNTWGGCQRVEFDLHGDGFAFTAQVPTSFFLKVWVDGRPHAAQMQQGGTVPGVSGTGTHHFLIDFGSVAYRRITLEWASLPASPSLTQGLRFKPTATVLPPRSRRRGS